MPTKDGRHAYTEEEKAEIIAHVLVNVACGRPVDRIFREDDMTENGFELPAQSTFWLWVFSDESGELSEKLVRAREYGIEALIDKAIATAETPQVGRIEIEKPMKVNGVIQMATEVRHEDMVAHRRLFIETMLKAAQMLKPKTYGPKLDVTSNNEKINFAERFDAAVKREEERLSKGGK